MREALLYTAADNGSVTCNLCMHRCRIRPGKRGLCGVRENKGGTLYSLVYGRLVACHVDPVEKKPLFHFLPASSTYSIATVGCNMRCLHCQNHEISQFPHLYQGKITGSVITPEAVVEAALSAGCKSISYTYVEPTVFYEFALETAVLARGGGIKNIFVSNGFMTPEANRALAKVLDGINIDLKAFTDSFYKKICRASLEPVLDTIRLLHELGVWVEVTTLIIPGLNDSPRELADIARFIHAVSPEIPWHVTAFHPSWQLTRPESTPLETLELAEQIGRDAGLCFVYQGNRPGSGGEDTHCPACGAELIIRRGFTLCENRMVHACCDQCGTRVPGVWL